MEDKRENVCDGLKNCIKFWLQYQLALLDGVATDEQREAEPWEK